MPTQPPGTGPPADAVYRRVTEATGLGDAEAYRDLTRLLTAGLR